MIRPNLYVYQGSFLWGDFAHLIRNAALPHTCIKFQPPSLLLTDIVSIFDYSAPRRVGLLNTAHGLWTDESRESHICNAAWLDGHIPMWGANPVMDGEKVIKRPIFGAKWVLGQLVEQGVIDGNDQDVKEIVGLRRLM